MFKRLRRGIQHTVTLAQALPSAAKRSWLKRMAVFSRTLPQQFDRPLPEMMARLTPSAPEHFLTEASSQKNNLPPDEIRRLADAVAAWHLASPLGICLRRSLLRYHFLRQAGLSVQIVFGARLKGQREGGGLGGHAWLTLNGSPYYENPGDYEGFAPMYVYPQNEL